MSVSLGSVYIELGLDPSSFDRSLASIKSQTATVAADLERSLRLSPQVNHAELTKLNAHLDRKQQHFQQVNAYLASNPLKPRVDTTQLDALEAKVERLNQRATTVKVGVTGGGDTEVDRLGKDIADKVGKSVAKAVGSSGGGLGLGNLLKSLNPMNLVGGLLSSAIGGLGAIGRGALEGVGRDLSRDLAAGISEGLNLKAAPLVGSFKLLGRELAAGLTEDLINALGDDADLIQKTIEGIVGKGKIVIERGAMEAAQQKEVAQKTNEASRYYAEQRNDPERVKQIKTQREEIIARAKTIDEVRSGLSDRTSQVKTSLEKGRGLKPGQLEAQAEKIRDQLGSVSEEAAAVSATLQRQVDELEAARKLFYKQEDSNKELQKLGALTEDDTKKLDALQKDIADKEKAVKGSLQENASIAAKSESLSLKLEQVVTTIKTLDETARDVLKEDYQKLAKIEEAHNEQIRRYNQLRAPFEATSVTGDVVAPSELPVKITETKQNIKQYEGRKGQLNTSYQATQDRIKNAQAAIDDELEMPEGWRNEAKITDNRLLIEALKKQQVKRKLLYEQFDEQIQIEQQKLKSYEAQATLPQVVTAQEKSVNEKLEAYQQKQQEWKKEAEIAFRAGEEDRGNQLLNAIRSADQQIEYMQSQLKGLEINTAWQEPKQIPQITQAQKDIAQAQVKQPNNPQVFNDIIQHVAQKSGVDLEGKQLPRLIADQTMSESTAAAYSHKDNQVRVPKELFDRIQSGSLTKEDYADLIHEGRHAVQYDFGARSSAEAVKATKLLTPTVDEYKQFSHQIEGSVAHQPDRVQSVSRKLEKDAYTFEHRETPGIVDNLMRQQAQENFESQFGAGGGKARLQVSQVKKNLLEKLKNRIDSSSVDISEELEELIKGLEHMQQSIEPILEQASNVDLPAEELDRLAYELPLELKKAELAMQKMAIGFSEAVQAKPAQVQEQLQGSLSQFNRKKVLVPLAEQFGIEDAGKLNKKDLIQQLTATENLRELQPQVNAMTRQRALQQMARRERMEDIAEGAGNLARGVGAGVQKAGAVVIDIANSPQAKAALTAIGGAAQPMLAVAKTGYALAAAMESVALDMVPMGRTAKKVMQAAALPAIAGAGVAMLPGGTAAMGGALELIGSAGAGLGHTLGASAGGQLGGAIAGGLPQAFGIQGAISSSISTLLTAGGTAAGEIGAQAAAILGAGRLIQKTLSNALPQLPEMPSLPPGTDKPQLPQAKVQDAIAVAATEAPRQLKAAIVNTDIPTASANPPPLALPPSTIQDGRTAIADQLKEQYSAAGLREVAKRAGMTAKTAKGMKKDDLAEFLASSPTGVPIDQILAEVGDSAKLKKFQTTGQSSVPKVPTEVLTSIRSASAKVQQLYKTFQQAQGQERINLAQTIAQQADQQVAAIDEALKTYQIKGSDAQSLAGLRTQLEQRSALPRNEARAAANPAVRQTQAQAQRTGASTNYQTIDIDVQALKSVQDIQEGILSQIERLRNAARGIGQRPPSPEVEAKIKQLTEEVDAQVGKHVAKQMQRLERDLEVASTRSIVQPVTPEKLDLVQPIAPSRNLQVQEIAAAKAQANINEDLPIQSLPKAAKFDAAAARIENQADQQAAKTQAAINASGGEGDDFTKLKAKAGQQISEYAAALRKGLGPLGRIIPQAIEEGVDKAPDVLGKLPGFVNNTAKSILENFGTIAKGFIAFQVVQQLVPSMVSFGKESLTAAMNLDRLKTAMNFAAGGAAAGGENLKFIEQTVSDLKIPLAAAREGFTQFSAATRGTKVEGESTKAVFLGMSQAATVLGLSADDTSGAFLALGQMASKGKVQAEELRGQLGERIPGAFGIAARAMGVTEAELNKMLETGQVLADDFLPKFGEQLKKEFGGSAVDASNNAQSAMFEFQNQVLKSQESFGKMIQPAQMVALNAASAAIKFLTDNTAALAPVLITVSAALGLTIINTLAQIPAVATAANAAFGVLRTGIGQTLAMMAPLALQIAVVYAAIEVGRNIFDRFVPSDLGKRFAESTNSIQGNLDKIAEAAKRARGEINQIKPPNPNEDLAPNGIVDMGIQQAKRLDESTGGGVRNVIKGLGAVAPVTGIATALAKRAGIRFETSSAAQFRTDKENVGKLADTANKAANIDENSAMASLVDVKSADEDLKRLQYRKQALQGAIQPDKKALADIDTQISDKTAARGKAGEGFSTQYDAVNKALKEAQANLKAIQDTNLPDSYKKQLTDPIEKSIIGLQSAKDKMDALQQSVGTVVDPTRKLLGAFEEINTKIEEINRNAARTFNEKMFAANSQAVKGFGTDLDASGKSAIAKAEADKERIQSLVEGTQTQLDEAQKAINDPTAKEVLKSITTSSGASINAESSVADIENAKKRLGDKDQPKKDILDQLKGYRESRDKLGELRPQLPAAELAIKEANQQMEQNRLNREAADEQAVLKRNEITRSTALIPQRSAITQERATLTTQKARNVFYSDADANVASAAIGIKEADAGIAQARAQIANTKDQEQAAASALERLRSAYDRGKISAEQFHNQERELTTQVAEARGKSIEANAALQDAFAKRTEAVAARIEAQNRRLLEQAEEMRQKALATIQLTQTRQTTTLQGDLLNSPDAGELSQAQAGRSQVLIEQSAAAARTAIKQRELEQTRQFAKDGVISRKEAADKERAITQELADAQAASMQRQVQMAQQLRDSRIKLLEGTAKLETEQIDRAKQLLEAQGALAKAQSDLSLTRTQGQLNVADRAVGLADRLESQKDLDPRIKDVIAKQLNNSGISGISANSKSYEILAAKQKLEDQIADKTKAAREQEFALAKKSFEFDQKKIAAADQLLLIEGKRYKLDADRAKLQAVKDFSAASKAGDKEGMQLAKASFEIAGNQSQLADEQLKAAQDRLDTDKQLADIGRQTLDINQQKVREEAFNADQLRRQNNELGFAEQYVKAGGVGSIPGRAKGGDVQAGKPYIVGEKGQELFIPKVSGEIIDASKTATILSGQNMQGARQAIEARATGGPVNAGQPYLVGEKGPEAFSPSGGGASGGMGSLLTMLGALIAAIGVSASGAAKTQPQQGPPASTAYVPKISGNGMADTAYHPAILGNGLSDTAYRPNANGIMSAPSTSAPSLGSNGIMGAVPTLDGGSLGGSGGGDVTSKLDQLISVISGAMSRPNLTVSSPQPVNDAAKIYSEISSQQVSNANI